MWSLAVLAVCLTSVYANTISSESLVITYDDIISNPVTSQLDPIPSPYKKLVFGAFNARADGVSILRSVSPNNTASSNALNNLVKGQTPNITSQYSGSPLSSFDLKGTYAGCALPTEASTGVPQPCTLQFKGTTTTGKTVSALCTYAGTPTQPQLQFCDFQGQLDGVTIVTILPTDTLLLSQATVEYLDNTTVVEHYK